MYKVFFEDKALKQLKKLDKSVSKIILNWIKNNLEECENPFYKGKQLQGNLKRYWRYRVGTYRIVADVKSDKIIILIVSIAHRREIYKILDNMIND